MFRPLDFRPHDSSSLSAALSRSSKSSTRFALSALSGALLATFIFSAPAHAITTLSDGSAKTALPGGVLVAKGWRTAVVSATVSEGDAIYAQRALVAANTALSRTRDFYPTPSADVARALQQLTTRGGTDLRAPEERRHLTDANKTYGEPEPVTDVRSPARCTGFSCVRQKAEG